MNWTTLKNAIHGWAAGVLGITTIWDGQNAPRPAYPYAVLNIVSDSQLGQDEIRYELDEDEDQLIPHIVGNRPFTISVQVHALGVDTARPYTSTLRTALKKPSTVALLKASEIAVVGTETTQNVREQVEGQWVSRSLIDIRLATVENSTDSNIDYIETLELAGTVNDTAVTDDTFGVGVDL